MDHYSKVICSMTAGKAYFTKQRLIIGASLLLLGLLEIVLDLMHLQEDIGDALSFFFLSLEIAGLAGLVYAAYHTLAYFNFFGFDRVRSVSLFIGLMLGIAFILADKYLTILQPIKEFSIDARFRISSVDFFREDIGEGIASRNQNPDAHPAIQIIGIDNPTVNEYQGFPFSWKHYADLLKALNRSEYKTLLFDIFFVDEVKDAFDAKKGKQGKLSSYIRNAKKVVADYSFETQSYHLSEKQWEVFKNKMRVFRKNRITNVISTEHDEMSEWVKFPEVPIIDILKGLQGTGYANIRKQDTGVNRTIPLVVKWENQIYPSIVLVALIHYYGIDIQKDVEVKLGSYIKLKNIPQKAIKVYDRDAANKIKIDSEGQFKIIEVDIMAKPNKERTITIPIDQEGFMYINFIGGSWSYPSIPFYTIADSEPGSFSGDYDAFKDKILLVAIYYATGVAKDIHASPFGDLAGIEHHANALNTILKQDFLVLAPPWINYLIYIFIGLTLGFIVPRYRMSLVLTGILSFSLLFALEVFFSFNVLNFVHVFFVPYIEIATVMITIVAYKALSEEENVKYIRSTFSKFVSSDVVEELLDNPEALTLGGESKDITVFFSDVRGFTTVAESLTASELVSLLNEYLSEMTKICLKYRGTIDKYMGDAIMAFWGAPIHDEDHPYRACLASLAQIKTLKKLQKKWIEEGRPPLDIGIGLNTGDAVVGNMGSAHRMDYTAMGDTINLGSRLEGTNKVYGTQIIISEPTYIKVKDKVISRELDLIRVKGKSEPVRIYELLDVKNQEDYTSFAREES